jgi:hypothetical protein
MTINTGNLSAGREGLWKTRNRTRRRVFHRSFPHWTSVASVGNFSETLTTVTPGCMKMVQRSLTLLRIISVDHQWVFQRNRSPTDQIRLWVPSHKTWYVGCCIRNDCVECANAITYDKRAKLSRVVQRYRNLTMHSQQDTRHKIILIRWCVFVRLWRRNGSSMRQCPWS